MPLQVVCPNPQCRKTMAIKDELAGQTLRCPTCNAKLSAVSRSDSLEASETAKDPSMIQAASAAKKSASSTPPTGSLTPPDSAGAPPRKPSRGGQREPMPARIGPYEVTQELGRGAFGVVYKGHDPQLKRDVAIKVLNRNALHSSKAVERFLREAQVVAQMHHNHIVPVFELGEHEESHYIASRFVPGKTLSDLIPDEGMDAVEAVELVLQLLEALTYAHEMNVLHRDIKPANAIVDAEGQLCLMDFGLAGWVGQTDGRATQDGTVMGTPSYMPPEQARGDINNVRETADQYSAGVVLYELLTGHVPFEGGPIVVLLHNVISTPPPRPSEFRADLDPQLEEICLKALAKAPEERYPSCHAFADALRTWKSVCGSSGTIVEPVVELGFAEAADLGVKRQTDRDTLSGDEAPARSIAWKKTTATTALISSGPKKKKRAGKPNNKGTLLLAAAGAGMALLLALVVLTARFVSKPADNPAQINGSKLYLYDLKEFDWVVNDNISKGDIPPNQGNAIIVKGERFKKGLFMHPRVNSDASGKFRLDGLEAFLFQARIAINDCAGNNCKTPLKFQVLGDGKVLWTSKPIQAARQTEDCIVEVEGIHVLELRVVCPGPHFSAMAVWLDPYLWSKK
jgi:serine/threonine protein kinase